MTSPTEKHRETAEKVVNDFRIIGDGCEGDLMEMIAAALANSEREGMKRAAEIARKQANIDWEDGDGGQYGHGYENACGDIATEILSEAGEGLSYSQSGLTYSDARGA